MLPSKIHFLPGLQVNRVGKKQNGRRHGAAVGDMAVLGHGIAGD
jgi:hypothetical protein